ncbi:MAG: STAS domain-containing protein [Desulfuromonadales bacterium]|nr:STAS domain-containing protein [Desulfuromonadales bacterium]
MENYTNGIGIKLTGHWNLSGLVHQIEPLSMLHKLEHGLGKLFRIDCSEINSVDRSGLQFLYTWMQCISMRGVKPELVNLPEAMQQTIKSLGLANCFSDFNKNLPDSCSNVSRTIRQLC